MEIKHDIVLDLIERFVGAGIDVCYWKPSSGLNRALSDPAKDVDLLVSRAEFEILKEAGFKEFPAPARFDLEGVTHWIKPAREGLCHIELHEKIYTGRTTPFTFRIPWVEVVLSNTREMRGVPVVAAEMEILLLAIRFAFEMKVGEAAVVEAMNEVDREVLREQMNALIGQKAGKRLFRALDTPFPKRDKVRAILEPQLVKIRSRKVARARSTARIARGVTRKIFQVARVDIRPRSQGLLREGRGLIFSAADPDAEQVMRGVAEWLDVWFDVHVVDLKIAADETWALKKRGEGALIFAVGATEHLDRDFVFRSDPSVGSSSLRYIEVTGREDAVRSQVWDVL